MLRTSKNIKSPSGLLANPTFVYTTPSSACKMVYGIYGTLQAVLYWYNMAKMYHWYSMAILYHRYGPPALPPMCILPLHQDAKCPLLKFTVCHSLSPTKHEEAYCQKLKSRGKAGRYITSNFNYNTQWQMIYRGVTI